MTTPRGLLALNAALGVAAALFATQIVRVYMTGPTSRTETARGDAGRAATARPPAESATPEARQGLPSYGTIASKSLFSPSRTDSDATAAAGASLGPKPFLYGVVLRDGGPIAYLEDPTSKRVAGYRVGDAIAGGVVETIAADRVVLKRSDGSIDVQLRDPSKPRPAVPEAPAAAQPTAPTTPPAAAVARPPIPSRTPTLPSAPASPVVPPNLLRRLQVPPPTSRDAPGQ
jgi:hypothetical protein